MTPEQFVYWLSGYLSGGRDNDDDVIVNDIEKALKAVTVTLNSGDIVFAHKVDFE